jgi:ABC-type phosphate/phosphonate transport system substrate-binding protein
MRIAAVVSLLVTAPAARAGDELDCWFAPGFDAAKGKAIAAALSKDGLSVTPRLAASYGEIFAAVESQRALVYAGSFAAALLYSRKLAVPLLQKVDGHEKYAGIMLLPKGADAQALLGSDPAAIAYASGSSSGESSAKAATGGKASVAVKDHFAAAQAVASGKAKAAFVKDQWWEANAAKFPDLQTYAVPGVSEKQNPDNLLLISSSASPELQAKVLHAAYAASDVFGARMQRFNPMGLSFSVQLMKKGAIDTRTYSW